jgi:hypothetical protein
MRTYLIICCFAGIAIPYFALPFVLVHGPNFRLFVEEIFATRISCFFAADLILSSVFFSRLVAPRSPARKIDGWCS